MSKLGTWQRDILKRMAAGEEIWTTSGIYASAFWHDDLSGRSPGTATVEALRRKGYIKAYSKEFTGSKYCITDDGRAAVFTLRQSPQVTEDTRHE